MSDKVIKIGESIIQHGKENDRVYLMKLHEKDLNDVLLIIDTLVKDNGYAKIFAKVPSDFKQKFKDCGYLIEAVVPEFYNGKKDALFLAKYFSQERKTINDEKKINDVLQTALQKSAKDLNIKFKEEFVFKKCRSEDSEQMAQIYSKVFESYPFPIDNPDYLADMMSNNVDYYAVCHEGSIISIASSEMDLEGKNTEMTDFATLPEYRGSNMSAYILSKMETDAAKNGIKTAYTIARSLSYGINICFAKMGYTFSGTLKNNTCICGSIESMNVWYKAI